jgi:hypothetical protein
MVEYYILINENRKMRSVETLPRMGGEEIQESDGGVNSTVIYCKNFVNVTMYPQ